MPGLFEPTPQYFTQISSLLDDIFTKLEVPKTNWDGTKNLPDVISLISALADLRDAITEPGP